MYTGYLALGGNEIANTDRIVGYSSTAECPAHWLRAVPCGTISEAMDDGAYVASNISSAPWFDPTQPDLSSRFYGVAVIDMQGRHDSSLRLSVTQALGEGGVLGDPRHATKEFRIRAVLLASGEDALGYGLDWLSSQLRPGACGQHGTSCGFADLAFFTQCPPPMVYMDDPENPGDQIPDRESYDELIRPIERYLHDVGVTSALSVREEMAVSSDPSGPKGALVEFSVTSERGYVYSRATPVPLLTTADAFEDVERNRFLNPTTDYPGPIQMIRRNLIPNPSLETSGTGWSGSATNGASNVAVTASRVSGELRAVGSYSEKVVPSAAATAVRVTSSQTIPQLSRYATIGIWGAVSDPSNLVTALYAEYLPAGGGSWIRFDEAPDVAAAKSGRYYKTDAPVALSSGTTGLLGIRFVAESAAGIVTAYADAAMAIEG